MRISINIFILIIISLIFFILGNIVYTPSLNFPWYISSILSELMFVFMYTIIDYGNLKYRYKFFVPHIIILLVLFLPLFLPLFYSQTAQYFSVSIAILAILVNSRVLYFLYKKGLGKIFCSRFSTSLATVVDVVLFSYILDIGLKGAILMIILRCLYIIILPKIVFFKNNLSLYT